MRPDINVITAVADDCANSRFPTIRELAEHMNTLLAYIGELERDRDAFHAEVKRLRDEAADQTNYIARINAHVQEQAKKVNGAEVFIDKIRDLAYVGGQDGETVRRWILDAFEQAGRRHA